MSYLALTQEAQASLPHRSQCPRVRSLPRCLPGSKPASLYHPSPPPTSPTQAFLHLHTPDT